MSIWRRSEPLFVNYFRKVLVFAFFFPPTGYSHCLHTRVDLKKKKNLCINGNQILTMILIFWGFSYHVSFWVLLFLALLGIFAVTLMRKMLNFRAAPVYPSVIALAVCSIDICCLPTSVPGALVNIFETKEPFPPLATSQLRFIGTHPGTEWSCWLSWLVTVL